MESTAMSALEFKNEVMRKGWTYRALAKRWNVGEGYISYLSRNPERPLHWDDAVRGLPTILRLPAKEPNKKKADRDHGPDTAQ
ncbi:hypothetical protein [Acidovorax sp.]|uniref:hypothetical protein n=1 Tax=Acidovorax sp. TaxID=1872122 RepID=UPI00391F27F9